MVRQINNIEVQSHAETIIRVRGRKVRSVVKNSAFSVVYVKCLINSDAITKQ
jgi:hypothetical protein